MRCPAIEGIETATQVVDVRHQRALRRMRCPAIEGIETESGLGVWGKGFSPVECVAPLLRGLKLQRRNYEHAVAGEFGRMRCPAIEGIETHTR